MSVDLYKEQLNCVFVTCAINYGFYTLIKNLNKSNRKNRETNCGAAELFDVF